MIIVIVVIVIIVIIRIIVVITIVLILIATRVLHARAARVLQRLQEAVGGPGRDLGLEGIHTYTHKYYK